MVLLGYFCIISICSFFAVQIERIEFSIWMVLKCASYLSGAVESRRINEMESFFKNLKRASFFVHISMNFCVLVDIFFSFSVRKRMGKALDDISSMSIPTDIFFELEIASATCVFECEIDMSASIVEKRGLPFSV